MGPLELQERLEEAARPYHLHDWELEEQVERLSVFGDDTQRRILDLFGSIWPVSHALAFLFLRYAGKGLEVLGDNRLQIWVGAVLDAYEEGGLDDARLVLADGGRAFLASLNGEVGLRFQDVASRLLPYLCGLAEGNLDLEAAERASTDTQVVCLPRRLNLFRERRRNFLLYKLTAAFQWSYIRGRTYRAELPPGSAAVGEVLDRYGLPWGERDAWLENYFHLFPEPDLARRIYHAAETVRLSALLARELPGLARDTIGLREELRRSHAAASREERRGRFFDEVQQAVLGGAEKMGGSGLPEVLTGLAEEGADASQSLAATARLYEMVAALPEGGEPEQLPFIGELRVSDAEDARRRRRREAKEEFIESLSAVLAGGALEPEGLPEPARPQEGQPPGRAGASPEEGGTAAAREDGADGTATDATVFLRIGAREVEVPAEMQSLVEEIRDDLGGIPESYISGVIARAGKASIDVEGPVPGEEGLALRAPLAYDEWDFRRAGFRKNWCLLHELDLEPEDRDFVQRTRRKYRGQLQKIRRSFEMMRTSERFLRRQREGEEIDIDAVVDSLGDVRAGRPASERLFVRLVRDVRDISALFLVDMSSSTEGWVSTVIKESLTLLCEALEILGDRYAIYGFSGMKRLRSELYRVKTFEEAYGDVVQGRIAAIAPKDYTRMGPPIRHGTEILTGTEAKVRLLVTLSDGKPEDYDEYKGDYAIEDTRHALIEAKAAGVHPFCITVDREASDYIAHMYGEVNYVTIDDARQLPTRVPEIYRILTT